MVGESERAPGDSDGGEGSGNGDQGGGKERDKFFDQSKVPMDFVFGTGGRGGASKPMEVPTRRASQLSYKEKLLSLGCGGYLVKHDETEDIVHGWKSFFAKKKMSEESSLDKEGSDMEETEGTTIKPKYPVLKVTNEQYMAWCQPWMNSLIIKLMGLQVPRHVLIDRIRRMWKPQDPMKVTPLSNDYYIISFTSKEDRDYAFQEGPWMIDDHYLIVQRWRPNFNPWKADNQRMIAAWIRIPDLPMEFYNVESLGIIGDMVGKTIKVDRSTSIYDKGGFARICVEIDLQQPLLTAFTAFGEDRQIVYEGLHQVCFHCGRYGHERHACPLITVSSMEDQLNTVNPISTDSVSGGKTAQIPASVSMPAMLDNHLGPQMLVSRDFRRIKVNEEKKGLSNNNGGADNKGFDNGFTIAGKKESGYMNIAKNQQRIKSKDTGKAIYRPVGSQKDQIAKNLGSGAKDRSFGQELSNNNGWVTIGSKRKIIDKSRLRGKENTLSKGKAKNKEGVVSHTGPIADYNPFSSLRDGPCDQENSQLHQDMGEGFLGSKDMGMDISHASESSSASMGIIYSSPQEVVTHGFLQVENMDIGQVRDTIASQIPNNVSP